MLHQENIFSWLHCVTLHDLNCQIKKTIQHNKNMPFSSCPGSLPLFQNDRERKNGGMDEKGLARARRPQSRPNLFSYQTLAQFRERNRPQAV